MSVARIEDRLLELVGWIIEGGYLTFDPGPSYALNDRGFTPTRSWSNHENDFDFFYFHFYGEFAFQIRFHSKDLPQDLFHRLIVTVTHHSPLHLILPKTSPLLRPRALFPQHRASIITLIIFIATIFPLPLAFSPPLLHLSPLHRLQKRLPFPTLPPNPHPHLLLPLPPFPPHPFHQIIPREPFQIPQIPHIVPVVPSFPPFTPRQARSDECCAVERGDAVFGR